MRGEGDVASEGRLVGKLYSWGKCTMVLIGASLSDPLTSELNHRKYFASTCNIHRHIQNIYIHLFQICKDKVENLSILK